MFSKSVFLFFLGAAVAFHLQWSPTDLQEYFQQINNKVRSLEDLTKFYLRSNIAPFRGYIIDARNDIIQNITLAAEPYWNTIKSLEDTAETKGQDISGCVDVGNNQISSLNNIIVNTAYDAINYYNESGEEIISASYSAAHGVIRELTILEEVVPECDDSACAAELMTVVTEYYERSQEILSDAETTARNYVFVYLPVLLSKYNLDLYAYQSNYTVFLNNITDCIDRL